MNKSKIKLTNQSEGKTGKMARKEETQLILEQIKSIRKVSNSIKEFSDAIKQYL